MNVEDQWAEQEENKRRTLNFTTACIIFWVTVTIQLMLPKAEVRALTLLETRLIFGNAICVLVVLVFLVYKIEASFLQVFNYAYFYILYLGLMLPHYDISAEIFIPCWIAGCFFYILVVVYSESAPFVIYPERPLPIEDLPRTISHKPRELPGIKVPAMSYQPLQTNTTVSRPSFLTQDEKKEQ